MGHMQAAEMAEATDIRTGVEWHLRHNHFPPVPEAMVDICIVAIQLAAGGRWVDHLELPEGVLYRGEVSAPIHAIVEQHHLEPWVDQVEPVEVGPCLAGTP